MFCQSLHPRPQARARRLQDGKLRHQGLMPIASADAARRRKARVREYPMSRTEQDFLGAREIGDDIYYGVQTIRGKENFHITGIPMSQEPYFVKALGYVKKAAAIANRELGALDPRTADAIIIGCDRVIAGDMMDQFVTDFIQGGAGTPHNKTANGGCRNRALEALGLAQGDYHHVSPTDHLNYGQSSSDPYPTAFRL